MQCAVAFFESIGSNYIRCRWPKNTGPGPKYSQFIPTIYRTTTRKDDSEDDEPVRVPAKKTKVETDKGALYYEYNFLAHQFIAHLRRVHPSRPAILMDVIGIEEKVLVKAADPLAKPPMPLYYTHRKTPMYNDNFFILWDNIIAEAFAITCPWFVVDSVKALDKLFSLEFCK